MTHGFANQNSQHTMPKQNSKYGRFSLLKVNKNTYPKGRALMQMYRVVVQTYRGNRNDVWYMVY